MALILNIDTALETASVCLDRDGVVLQLTVNDNQKDHAAWLHPAIASLLREQQCTVRDLDAVAVSIGPGSYTGLRIGLSAAKGLCYTLGIPLVTVGTLPVMARAVKGETAALICPLVDARRMEVYAAVYDQAGEEKTAPHARVLDPLSFSEILSGPPVLFCGSGSRKFEAICADPRAVFSKTTSNAIQLAELSRDLFSKKIIAPLAYTEPLYIKEFYSPAANKT